MTQHIRVLGDVELTGSLSFTYDLNQFPINPSPRTITVKDGMPYIYTELIAGSGFFSWMPLGVKQTTYLHTQGLPSTTWTVKHNFNSTNFAYFVYDSQHNLVLANISIVDNNTAQILLSSAMVGTAVFFSIDNVTAPYINAMSVLSVGNVQLGDTAGRLTVNGTAVATASELQALLGDYYSKQQVDAIVAASTANIKQVAYSSSYNDLINKPTIPSVVSQLSNDANYLTSTQADQKITDAIGNVPGIMDTLNQINAQITADPTGVLALSSSISTKADQTYVDTELANKTSIGHLHNISDVTNLQSELDSKATSSLLATVATTGSYNDLLAKPSLGSSASKDIPTVGSNATETQVVVGSDTRLTDARRASDVFPWAKTVNKPSYTANEVGAAALNGSPTIDFAADNITVSGDVSISGNQYIASNLTITGNLIVNGSNTIVDSTTITTKDNIIVINSGEQGNGVTAGSAGLQVDRGTQTDYLFAFDEAEDMFKVGMIGQLETVATRPWVVANYATTTHIHSDATTTVSGLLSAADKTKLNNASTLTDIQTLTNKTIEAGTFTKGWTEQLATANSGTAYTFNLTNGTVFIITLTGNVTYTFPTPVAGRGFSVFQKQDATGSRTVTWPASVKWAGGTAPTLTTTASKTDRLVFTSDGTYWYGGVAGLNY